MVGEGHVPVVAVLDSRGQKGRRGHCCPQRARTLDTYHDEPRGGENRLDHLWIRVRDLVESRLFYETVVPAVGLRVHDGSANRFHVTSGRRSFALVREDPGP